MKWSQFPFGLFKTNSDLQNTVKTQSDIVASGATQWRGFYHAARQACVCVHQKWHFKPPNSMFFFCLFVFAVICRNWCSPCDQWPESQAAAVITQSAHNEMCPDFQHKYYAPTYTLTSTHTGVHRAVMLTGCKYVTKTLDAPLMRLSARPNMT